jgi:hypothetical protein
MGATGSGGAYNKFVNQPGGSVRFDVNVDGIVSIGDIVAAGSAHGTFCRRVDGTFGTVQ